MPSRILDVLASDANNRILRGVFLVVLATALVFYGVYTRHWPMLVNAPVMHYVNFLMSHGLRPYSQITDMNMPGAYLLERTGMVLFGAGDAGWRFYDLFLLAVIMLSMVVITRRTDWMAGVYAAGFFALRHGSEGPWFTGEREQEMATLLIAACALLFTAVRNKRPFWMFGFGFLAGMATSIKPTLLPFDVISLAILWLALHRRGEASGRYLLFGAGGFFTAGMLSVLFLWRYHAFAQFLFVLRTVTPVYAALNDPGWRFLVKYAVPHEWLFLIALGILGTVLYRRWDWEHWILVLGAACGAFSYFAQRKGFWYQRYMLLVFGLLLVSMAIFPGRKGPWLRLVGSTAFLYGALYLVPRSLHEFRRLPMSSALTTSMEADLRRMGTDRLQGGVQCFDMTFGCLNSLYHLGLVENSGFTGDMLLFPATRSAASEFYQQLFWKLQEKRPADVIVVTNQDFGHENDFARIARWPEFSRYLAKNYTMTVFRSFPLEDRYRDQPPASADKAPAYRIFRRNAAEDACREMKCNERPGRVER